MTNLDQFTRSGRALMVRTHRTRAAAALLGGGEVQWPGTLGEAAQRLRVAQAVVDQLTSVDPARADPSVVVLACEELHQAELDYLRRRGQPPG
jgi:hypothetical protein